MIEINEFEIEGIRLLGVHNAWLCAGRTCVLHNPLNHGMRDWKLHYRSDRGIFERICSHGIGHPDPSQFEFWMEMNAMYEAVHGCDGCCFEEKEIA